MKGIENIRVRVNHLYLAYFWDTSFAAGPTAWLLRARRCYWTRNSLCNTRVAESQRCRQSSGQDLRDPGPFFMLLACQVIAERDQYQSHTARMSLWTLDCIQRHKIRQLADCASSVASFRVNITPWQHCKFGSSLPILNKCPR